MKAFVLSGGGNRGPLEVGALRALLDAQIQPDFLVGTSAGAINAAFVAARGFSTGTLDALANRWRTVDAKTVYPGSLASVAWRVLRRRGSLYASDGVRKLIEDGLPEGVSQFGQLKLPLYVPAADLLSNSLHMFGEDGNAPLVEAVLASASVPVIHPPVRYHGRQLVDGGVLANVAASFAMDKGATEIYVVNVSAGEQEEEYAEGVVDVAFRSLNTMIVQSLLRDLARAREHEEIDLHHIHIRAFSDTWFKDFSHTEEMFSAGYEATDEYLHAPRPEDAELHDAEIVSAGPIVPGAREVPIPYP